MQAEEEGLVVMVEVQRTSKPSAEDIEELVVYVRATVCIPALLARCLPAAWSGSMV